MESKAATLYILVSFPFNVEAELDRACWHFSTGTLYFSYDYTVILDSESILKS